MAVLPVLCLGAALTSIQRTPEASLARLAYGRGELEARYPTASGFFRIYSRPGGGGHGFAYYPLGVASRRYVLNDGSLALQKIRGGRTRNEWTLRLRRSRGAKPTSGTLRRVLWGYGLQAPRGLTSAQTKALDAVRRFAEYRQHPYGEPYADVLWARLVREDGTSTRGEMFDPDPMHFDAKKAYAPILAEEAVAVGLGKRRWLGPGGLEAIPAPTAP